MRRSFANLQRILNAAGLGLTNVVKVSCYVGRQEYLQEYNEIYREFFAAPYPARTTIMGCLGDLLRLRRIL